MESKDKSFYYIKTKNIIKPIKILKTTGDKVKYKEMVGYVLINEPTKRVYISEFSLIQDYKRKIKDANLTTENILKMKFLKPIKEIFFSFIEDFQILITTFLKIISKIILIPVIPFYLIYEVFSYKSLVSFFDQFKTMNKEETEYI